MLAKRYSALDSKLSKIYEAVSDKYLEVTNIFKAFRVRLGIKFWFYINSFSRSISCHPDENITECKHNVCALKWEFEEISSKRCEETNARCL